MDAFVDGEWQYKAVPMAATVSPKLFSLMMTAAGTVRPAKVFILGAGGGPQAIATARRLGAVVEAYDIRSDTKEQVESLGAKFVEFDPGVGDQQDRAATRRSSPTSRRRCRLLMAEVIQAADAVITTAQVRGAARLASSPRTSSRHEARRGRVDMAADSGGNCAHQAREEVVVNGVTILGLATRHLVGSTTASSSPRTWRRSWA